MAVMELEERVHRGQERVLVDAPEVSAVPNDERGALQAYREELDVYYRTLRSYEGFEPDLVLASISGIAARLTEMRADLHRSGSARAKAFRCNEVDPLIESLDFQFKVHSRLQAIREFDLRMTGGAPA